MLEAKKIGGECSWSRKRKCLTLHKDSTVQRVSPESGGQCSQHGQIREEGRMAVGSVEKVGLLNSLDSVWTWGTVSLWRPGWIEFMILPQSPKCWDYGHAPPHLLSFGLRN